MAEIQYKNGQFSEVDNALKPLVNNIPNGLELMRQARNNVKGLGYSGFINNREMMLRVVNTDQKFVDLLRAFHVAIVRDGFGSFQKEMLGLFDAGQAYLEKYSNPYSLANYFNYVIQGVPVGRAFASSLSGVSHAVPIMGAVATIATKAVGFVNKIASKLKGKTQKHVLDEVGTLDGYILTRYGGVMSRNEIYDQIIDPFKRQFKLYSGDIPNIKLGGNYNKEMTRVANYYAAYIIAFEPNILKQWEANVQSGSTVGTALLNASGFQYRKNVIPFTDDEARKILANAGKEVEGGGGAVPEILQAGFGGVTGWIMFAVLALIVGGLFLRKN